MSMKNMCKKDAAHLHQDKLNKELDAILTSEKRCAVELSAWLTQDADHMAMGIIILVDAVEKMAKAMPRVEIVNLDELLGIQTEPHHN